MGIPSSGDGHGFPHFRGILSHFLFFFFFSYGAGNGGKSFQWDTEGNKYLTVISLPYTMQNGVWRFSSTILNLVHFKYFVFCNFITILYLERSHCSDMSCMVQGHRDSFVLNLFYLELWRNESDLFCVCFC